jgi:hypothetical protein
MNTFEITTLTSQNGETYYKGLCPETDRVIYSFTIDFEDFWTQEDQDLYTFDKSK